MAKKARTPTPPRRAQAPRAPGPRQRGPATRADADRRSRLILYGLAATGIIGLAVVLAVFAFAGGGKNDSKAVASALQDVGWTFKTYPAQPRSPHYETPNPKNPMKYNSFPPTSGLHYAVTVVWGQYDQPVNLFQQIHNLEHGGIIVNWGNKVPASDVAKIRAFYREDANAMLVAPLPKLGTKIAMTAWTHLAEGTKFNLAAARKFRDAFRYKGPEQIPADQLNPGQ